MIRHFGRHLYQSAYDHLDGALGGLGWMTAGGFKSQLLRMQTYIPDETGAALAPNLAALTLLDEGPELEAAMGDLLVETDVTFVVDIFGENQAVALAIAEDVKDVLRGRINGYRRIIPVYDYTAGAANKVHLDGVWAENEDVVRMPSNRTELRRQWQVVRWTCHVEYVPSYGGV